MHDDDSLGCAAGLWVFWRWITGGDGGCLRWIVVVGLSIVAVAVTVRG